MKIENNLFTLPTDDAAKAQGCYVDLEQPTKIIRFLETECIQSIDQWAGKPLTLLPWQVALINTFAGWRRANGKARFTSANIFIGKKQGKSTLEAGLILYQLLSSDNEMALCMSATRQQAQVVYDQVGDFIDANPKLSKLLWRRDHIHEIRFHKHLKRKGYIKCQSLTDKRKSGFNSGFILVDEICEAPHYARQTWGKLQSAGAARGEKVIVTISTAQYDRNTVGYELYCKAKSILSGEDTNIHKLPVVYEVEGDWENPDNWWPALPSCPAIVPREYYLERYNEVKGHPLDEYDFKTLDLNVWCSSPESFIPAATFAACATDYKLDDFKGCDGYLGVDYGATYDCTALVLLVKRGEEIYCFPHAYIPAETATEREKSDGVPYSAWHRDPKANLTLTPGNVVDSDTLINEIDRLNKTVKIKGIYYDQTRLEGWRQLLERKGYNLVSVPQATSHTAPAFEYFDKLVRDGKFRHNGDKVLAAHLANCRPKRDDNDRLKIVKAADGAKKDLIDATAFALIGYLEPETPVPNRAPISFW